MRSSRWRDSWWFFLRSEGTYHSGIVCAVPELEERCVESARVKATLMKMSACIYIYKKKKNYHSNISVSDLRLSELEHSRAVETVTAVSSVIIEGLVQAVRLRLCI